MSFLEIGALALACGLTATVGDLVWTAWKNRAVPRHRKEQ